jgi:hypothetical protein
MSENVYAICGLKRKRGELAGTILTVERQLKDLRGDLTALDRSLQLLDPSIVPARIKPIRPRQRFKYFKSGELPRLLLDTLRKAQDPVLNCDLVEAVMSAKELDPHHKDTRHAVENRVRAAMQRFELKGTVERIGKGRGSQWNLSAATD